jgi:hypothetical protein
MRLGIMQPYFFPYLGYYQLMNCVDQIVLYDNIQYTKKGWINRNQILLNGKIHKISVPVQKAPHDTDIADIWLVPDAAKHRAYILRIIQNAYQASPFYHEIQPFLESCINLNHTCLFEYIFVGIERTAEFLQMNTRIIRSSEIPVNHSLKGQERVLAICKACGANEYVNLPGGRDLYAASDFKKEGVQLDFIRPELSPYAQASSAEFIPYLSIIDVLMGVGLDAARELVQGGVVGD